MPLSYIRAPRSVDGNNIKGSGEAFGDAFRANSSLKELTMWGCSLEPEDAKGLAAGLSINTHLQKVLPCIYLSIRMHLSAG